MRGSSDVPPQTLAWQAPAQRGSTSLGSIAYSPATRGLTAPCRHTLTDSDTRAGTSTASDVPPQTLTWQAPGQRGSTSLGSIAYSPATRGRAAPCRHTLTDSDTRAGTSTAGSLFRAWIAILASAVVTIGATRAHWATHIDLVTGRPVLTDRYARFLAGEGVAIWPSRGSNAVPIAFNPNTGLVYTSTWNVPRIQLEHQFDGDHVHPQRSAVCDRGVWTRGQSLANRYAAGQVPTGGSVWTCAVLPE